MSVWLWLVTYSVSIPAIRLLSSCQPPDPLADEHDDPLLRLGEQPPGRPAAVVHQRQLGRGVDEEGGLAGLEAVVRLRPEEPRGVWRARVAQQAHIRLERARRRLGVERGATLVVEPRR